MFLKGSGRRMNAELRSQVTGWAKVARLLAGITVLAFFLLWCWMRFDGEIHERSGAVVVQNGDRGRDEVLFEPSVLDLGVVISGHTYDDQVSIINATQKPVEIVEIERSCGCIVAGKERFRLEVGEGRAIPISVSIRSSQGEIRKTLRVVYLVGEEQRSRQLLVRAKVVQDGGLQIVPQRLDFGTTTKNGFVSGQVKLSKVVRSHGGIAGVSVLHAPKWLNVAFSMDDATLPEWLIEVEGNAPGEVGEYGADIELAAECEDGTALPVKIPFNVVVIGEYQLTPSRLVKVVSEGSSNAIPIRVRPRSARKSIWWVEGMYCNRISGPPISVTSEMVKWSPMAKMHDITFVARLPQVDGIGRGSLRIPIFDSGGLVEELSLPYVVIPERK